MASAPFSQEMRRVRMADRGLSYLGSTLQRDAPSLLYHLVKRVLVEEQWATGTTSAEYLADIRHAVEWPGAGVQVYRRWNENFAATITPTIEIVPPERRGPQWRPNLFVVYSADESAIVTGYMFSTLAHINVPGDVLWLR